MDDKLNELKHSPIYAMSLGSKELFHSNFWKWLITEDFNFASVFFDDLPQIIALHTENI